MRINLNEQKSKRQQPQIRSNKNSRSWFLRHSLGSFLGQKSIFGLGFGLGFGTHDSTAPLFPVLFIFVVEVSLEQKRNISNELK